MVSCLFAGALGITLRWRELHRRASMTNARSPGRSSRALDARNTLRFNRGVLRLINFNVTTKYLLGQSRRVHQFGRERPLQAGLEDLGCRVAPSVLRIRRHQVRGRPWNRHRP